MFKNSNTWIYLIKDNDTGFHKIGKSINPLQRLKQLKLQPMLLPKPFDFVLVDAWYCLATEELKLHTYFRKKRVRGEWFDLDEQDLLDFERCLFEKTRLSTRKSDFEVLAETHGLPVVLEVSNADVWAF